jgi:hypothetical protein
MIIKNLGIFDENFIIFGQVELLKYNQTRKKHINQGLRFNQRLVWVQLGDRSKSGCKLGISSTHRESEKRERVITWQHLIGPPQHINVMWQHPIGPPHLCGSHT